MDEFERKIFEFVIDWLIKNNLGKLVDIFEDICI